MKSSSQILLAKLELNEGEDPGVDGSNVIETVDGITVTQYDGDKVQRNIDSVAPTSGHEINKSPHSSWACNVDAAGSGDPATPPTFSTLLRICGFKESIDNTAGSEKVVYTLSHHQSATATLVKHAGGTMVQKTHGARGECSIDLSNFVRLQFQNLKGSYVRPAAMPTPSELIYDNYADPLPINKQNTVIAKLGNTDIVFNAGSISFGGSTSYLNLPNQEMSQHGEFAATGQITFIAPDISEKNWFADAESHNGVVEIPFALQHGTIAGNIIEINSIRVQLSNLSETDINGSIGYTADLRFLDAPTITFR